MDPYNFVKLDPDQPQRKKLDPDPDLDQHCDTGSRLLWRLAMDPD